MTRPTKRWYSRPALRRLQLTEYWLIAKLTAAILRVLRLFPARPALDIAGWTARKVGPLSSRHKLALENIRHAMPELSERERKEIALSMWENMGRLAVEYVFLDQLANFIDEGNRSKNIEWKGVEIFNRVRDENKPHILFTGHIGNFELLPLTAQRYGMQLTALFRPPNNPYIADEVARIRQMSSGDMLANHAGVAFTLSRILEEGGNIGALVDQKHHAGMLTTFFGRPCQTSPLLAKLARQFDCDIYPCLCIRLPGNRYRIEFCEKLELPRTCEGEIDIHSTAQMFNDVVEEWVRSYPGQWMWFHRRWEVRKRKRKRLAAR